MSDKAIPTQPKSIPKDGQVILSIMKEMGITDYEPKTVVQLTEFVYRYATSILEEARSYANNSDKEVLDVDHVRLALQLASEAAFTAPLPREVMLECANARNYTPLPLVKPHCGLRLPPDRHCLASCNYILKSSHKKTKVNYSGNGNNGPTIKMAPKTNISYMKRSPIGSPKQLPLMPRYQTAKIPKPKITTTTPVVAAKSIIKPKIQISGHTVHGPSTSTTDGHLMDIESSMKRKREDDEIL